MAKANPYAMIVKKLDALQLKAENLRKEIKALSILVMAQSKKSQSAPAVKKTTKKATRKAGAKKARAKKPAAKKAASKKESAALTVFRPSPVKKAKPRKR